MHGTVVDARLDRVRVPSPCSNFVCVMLLCVLCVVCLLLFYGVISCTVLFVCLLYLLIRLLAATRGYADAEWANSGARVQACGQPCS